MYLRLISLLATFLLLLVGSGAALQVHERIEHRDQDAASIGSAGEHIRLSARDAIHPAKPLHTHAHDDCATCDLLLHLVVVATFLLFVFGLFAAAISLRPASIAWPDLAACLSPRSSRGPPALV